MKKMYKAAGFLSLIGALVAGVPAQTGWAGPLVNLGGAAATPSKYEVTIKKLELRRSDGSYFTVFSGSAAIDLGNNSVATGGIGGTIGAGVSIPPGTYNGMRTTFARGFNVNGSVVTGGGTCATGGALNFPLGGYTLQQVSRNVAASDRVLSIPPEADAALNGVLGLAVVGGDIQVTATIPSFTLAANDTTPPALGVQFDVANTLEFLWTGAACVAIALPPTVTITTGGGSTTLTPPSL